MTEFEPFRLSIPQDSLDRLKQKLSLTFLPDELEDSEWEYGTPLADVRRLLHYWQEKYDWRHHEAQINKLPQYTTRISVKDFDDLDLHFLHQPSSVKNAIPLLFVHGWPGSFLEVTKILPLLSNVKDGEPAFHIVAPSLPNYGFSQGVTKKGFALPQYAEACHNLMLKLGYLQYGGDWGTWITRTIGLLYPSACKASHINMVAAQPPSPTDHPAHGLQHALTPYTDAEKAGLARSEWFQEEGSGYNKIQSTKPQTLGYALADSPVGLLAWIFEKLHDWTDAYPWTDDEILTWVSIYLFSTAGPAASLRIYRESTHADDQIVRLRSEARRFVPLVKLGLAVFPKDLYVQPLSWGRTLGPVVFEHVNESGGHFAAWECPESVAGDLKEMFGKGGGAEGVVEGRSGVGG
ncbi:MAG: hypothetical protein L6R40_004514 [Gallowayella cf. fulva]|nr:MAG: hypothetical protein L6R40_004514 [Xanthomendoza cf. fulva]